MRIAWTTDLHLNIASDAAIDQFIEEVQDVRPNAVLVGGDIGEADSFTKHLESDVILNDYLLIQELREISSDGDVPSFENILSINMMEALKSLGDEAATHFRVVLPEAFEHCDHVFLLMHVPPFREACWHNGHLSDDNWVPHFTCVVAGDAIGYHGA